MKKQVILGLEEGKFKVSLEYFIVLEIKVVFKI